MKDVIVLILSIMIIICFFADSYSILEGKISTENPNVLLLIGNISGAWQALALTVVAYWFGTTKSSSEKDRTTADAISKLPSAGTVSATVTAPLNAEQPKTGA